MKKIVICVGHLTPALALIEYLKSKKNHQLIFLGRRHSTEGNKSLSAEYIQIQKERIPFVEITTGRLQRKFTRYTLLSLLKVPLGFVQSLFFLIKYRPELVVSFGGYLSVPVVFAAWLLGIESIAHEQASTPGLATKINSLFVSRVFLTWSQTKKYFSETKAEVIGNLVRPSFFKKIAHDQKLKNFLDKSNNLIFITGGNQGSHFLNKLVFESLNKLKGYSVIHQVGITNHQGDLDRAQKIKKANYFPIDYLDSQNIGAVFTRADLIISRSGANTIWEEAILAKVAVLIPLPISASNEQTANAQILEKAGSAKVLDQEKVTPDSLLKDIDRILKNLNGFQKKADNFASILPKDGLKKIGKYI